MSVGKDETTSPVIRAIRWADSRCKYPISVVMHHRIFEWNVKRSALQTWKTLQEEQDAPSILIYLNLRKYEFVIVLKSELKEKLPAHYLQGVSGAFREDLQSTFYENAIAITIRTLALTLPKN
jgi:hypothetical protein